MLAAFGHRDEVVGAGGWGGEEQRVVVIAAAAVAEEQAGECGAGPAAEIEPPCEGCEVVAKWRGESLQELNVAGIVWAILMCLVMC